MTLLFMDGFDVGDHALKWTNSGGGNGVTSSTDTRFSAGRSVCLGASSHLYKTFTPASNLFCGFAFRSANSSIAEVMDFYGDGYTTLHVYVSVLATGAIRLTQGNGTVLGTSAAGVIQVNRWAYIEVNVTVADSGGRAVLKVDGVTHIDFTGDTKNGGTATTIDTIQANSTGSVVLYYDDFYVCDNSGSAPNNTFLGDVRVQTLLPTGAGASTQWTPSVGNNWDNVNDAPYSAATYNSANAAGLRDTYAMSDVNSATDTIFGVQANLLALKTDSGSANVKHVVRSGGTDYSGADRVLSTSLASYVAVREVDPATSVAWDNAGINAVEFGMEVV